MTDFIAVCPVHGSFAARNLFGGTGALTLRSVATNCPICGHSSPISDGTYDLIGSLVKAFRAPGITLENIESLKNIAQAEKDGTLSPDKAKQEAEKISPAFASLLKWTNGNAGALSILIAIITMFISIYAIHDSDQSSNKAHEDAQQQIQMQQMIYENLQGQHIFKKTREVELPSLQSKQPLTPNRKSAPAKPNRHERRKAKACAKRQSRPL